MRNAFAQTMKTVGESDPKLAVLVGDISHYALQPFAQACPGRYYNVGILEPTIISMAAGLAQSGLYPVAHTIVSFLIERSLEQIKLDFCYQGLGGTLISVGGAFDYSGLGCSHHCYSDLGLIKGLPNTEVIYPASPVEFTALFKQTYKNNQLTYFRLPGVQHSISFTEAEIKLGQGIRVREGKDLTILATGPHLQLAMKSAEQLSTRGVAADVLYYPTIKPFDEKLVHQSVSKTKKVITIEEHARVGGIGSDVFWATKDIGGVRYSSIDIPNQFQRGYGTYQDHLNHMGFTAENLIHKVDTELLKYF